MATGRAHRPGSSDGDGEADVKQATKRWTASESMAVALLRSCYVGCEAAMFAASGGDAPLFFAEFDLYNKFVSEC